MSFWDKSNPDPTNANPDPANKETVSNTNQPNPAELIAEALKPFGEQFTQLNQRLNTIEENSRPKPKPVEVAELTSVYEDENAAFNQRLTPIAMRQLELEARMVRDDVRREYDDLGFGDMWKQYAGEIDQFLSGSPLVTADGKSLRGDPAYIRNVVDMVLGRAARTKGLKFNGKEQSFFLESAGGSASEASTAANDGLTDKQRRVFERMGVPVADGKKTIEKLQFIN